MTPTIEKAAAVERWWSNLPESERRDWYRPAELVQLVPLSSAVLPHIMAVAGWSRVLRRTAPGTRSVLYAPPGATVPEFAVGRDEMLARLFGLPAGMAFYE